MLGESIGMQEADRDRINPGLAQLHNCALYGIEVQRVQHAAINGYAFRDLKAVGPPGQRFWSGHRIVV